MIQGNEIEIEAPSGLAAEDTMQKYEEELPQQDDAESMNSNESSGVNDASSSSLFSKTSYSNLSSNAKWIVIAIGSTAVFLAVGLGAGFGIGKYENKRNDDATTVSSAMAATTSDYSAYSHGHGSKSGKSAKCYFGPVTESYIGDVVRRTDDIYYWGKNGVCADPTFVFDPTVRGTSSYCNDDPDYPNAKQVGSARGQCNVAPSEFGGPCPDLSSGSGVTNLYNCEWNCDETLVINGDYLFLKYVFQDDGSSVVESGTTLDLGYPRRFDVIVTGGTGCYQKIKGEIIDGYTEYSDTYYYTYDLTSLK